MQDELGRGLTHAELARRAGGMRGLYLVPCG